MDAPSVSTDVRLQLRAAEPRDIAATAAIEAACFSDPWPASAFDSLLESVATHLTVAVLDNRVVGYSVVIHVIDEGELANIAVDASARRHGVARALMDALMSRARRDQLHSMFLEVRESNVGARALYEAFGFSALTRRKGYYQRPDEDAIVMVWRPGAQVVRS